MTIARCQFATLQKNPGPGGLARIPMATGDRLDYGLSQFVGPLAGLVFLVLVGAADDLHGPALGRVDIARRKQITDALVQRRLEFACCRR